MNSNLARSVTAYWGLAAVCLLGGGCAAAPDPVQCERLAGKGTAPRHYACVKATAAPAIDGRMDDPAWQSAAWTEEFVDIEGDRKPKPLYRTRAKMLWDSQALYIAAELDEPHVRATLKLHDSIIFHDPDFEVFIDPNGDSKDYFEIEANALGTVFDLLLKRTYRNGGPAIHAWNAEGLKIATHVDGTLNNPGDTDRNWSVEMAIPWTALASLAGTACPPRERDIWRFGFSRVEWPTKIVDGKYQTPEGSREDNWVWSPQGVIDMHRPERWAYVVFVTK